MKTYPSISNKIDRHKKIYAFDKLDGSNIRAEWNPKRGFYKFGSRTQLLTNDSILYRSKGLIEDKYGEALNKIFHEQKYKKAIAFFEFYGPSSFAGSHNATEDQTVTLFDVSYDTKGLMEPKSFLKLFDNKVEIAQLLYEGYPDQGFLEQVINGTLEGMTFEGVICKGSYVSPGRPLMYKIKNEDWIFKVKETYKGNEKLIQKLL